ncbi:MAG: hypothetical protein IPM96_18800 [Ignavibacteria bacterium]|nr:hypothetical protein [Ignavibacteria bacterium]
MKSTILPFLFLILFAYTSFFSNNKIYAQGFNSVSTSDGLSAIAVGNSGKLYRSINGGSNWTSYPNYNINFNDVCTYGNDYWISADSGKVFKTQTFLSSILNYSVGSSENLNSIDFIDANVGFVCGNSGKVYKTLNGGINWTLSNSGINTVNLSAIDFIDLNTGRVVGSSGSIFLTTNGGLSWSQEISGTSRNLIDVKFFGSYILVTGEYGILLNKNGSSSWTSVNTRTRSDINSVSGVSINDIRICGGGGFIRNNINGNTEFLNFEKNPTLADLKDMVIFSGLGFAVSSMNNAIIRTTNGGTTWELPSEQRSLIIGFQNPAPAEIFSEIICLFIRWTEIQFL